MASILAPPEVDFMQDEIRRLFDATDTDGNQSITLDELMTLMSKARRKPVSMDEAMALCERLDRNNDRVIEWDDLKTYMMEWLSENRQGRGPAAVLDRGGMHASIGLFFSQFETLAKDELLHRLFDATLPVEGDIDTLFRGDPLYTPEQQRQKLDHALQIFESTDPRMLEVDLYASEAECVLRAVTRLRDMLELVEVFNTEHQRFLLRHHLLEVYTYLITGPSLIDPHGAAMQLPFLRLNWLLHPSLYPQVSAPLLTATLQALYYFLLGPRLPNAALQLVGTSAAPSFRFHRSHFVQFKAQLFMQQKDNNYGRSERCSILHNLRGFITLGLAADATVHSLELCEWACKALGAYCEHHADAVNSALEDGYLKTIMDVALALSERYRQNETEACLTVRALRASTYALAVLCGHTHSLHQGGPLQSFLASKGATPETLLQYLRERLQEAFDAGVCANLVLALRNASAADAANGSLEPTSDFALCATMDVLFKGWVLEAGAPVYLTVLSSLLEDKERLERVLRSPLANQLIEPLRCVLSLPTSFSRLTLLGIELVRFAAEKQLFKWAHSFVEPLVALLQRDQVDVSERVLEALQYMFNAEPNVLVSMISYGVVPALFSTFLKFRQHDNVLAAVYGIVGYVYNVQTVLRASRILESIIKKEDTGVQAAFLQAIALDDVEKIGLLHRQLISDLRRKMGGTRYLRITESFSKNSTTAEKVTALNQSLESQLRGLKALCDKYPSASTSAISRHIQQQILPKWRTDLTAIIVANIQSDSLDPMQASDDMGFLECENMDGPEIDVNLVPKTPNWPAQPVLVRTRVTVSFEEMHRFIFSHYHVSPVKIFMPSRSAGSPPTEISGDQQLRTYLATCVNGQGLAAELELQLTLMGGAWGPSGMGGASQAFGVGLEPPTQEVVEAELRKDKLTIDAGLLGRLRDYFRQPDRMWGGRDLSWQEFQAFMTHHGWTGHHPSALKMLFDIFDEDNNGRLSYMELARLLALMVEQNPERERFIFRRHSNSDAGLTLDGLTQLLNHTDSSQPEKHNRRLAEQWFQRRGLNPAQTMSFDQFRDCLSDGMRESIKFFLWFKLQKNNQQGQKRGQGGGGQQDGGQQGGGRGGKQQRGGNGGQQQGQQQGGQQGGQQRGRGGNGGGGRGGGQQQGQGRGGRGRGGGGGQGRGGGYNGGGYNGGGGGGQGGGGGDSY